MPESLIRREPKDTERPTASRTAPSRGWSRTTGASGPRPLPVASPSEFQPRAQVSAGWRAVWLSSLVPRTGRRCAGRTSGPAVSCRDTARQSGLRPPLTGRLPGLRGGAPHDPRGRVVSGTCGRRRSRAVAGPAVFQLHELNLSVPFLGGRASRAPRHPQVAGASSTWPLGGFTVSAVTTGLVMPRGVVSRVARDEHHGSHGVPTVAGGPRTVYAQTPRPAGCLVTQLRTRARGGCPRRPPSAPRPVACPLRPPSP